MKVTQKTTRIKLDLTDAQIVQLRAVMDGLPLNPYIGLVVAVVTQLPLESVGDSTPAAGAPPVSAPLGTGAGFSMVAFNDKGKAGLEQVARLLDKLGYGS